jgi:hypothetical protein
MNRRNNTISRREALAHISALLGGAALVSGSSLLLAADVDVSQSSTALFTANEIAWLDEVAETILPATKTPGARAAGVGTYIAVMVTDVYEPADQAVFRAGMESLENDCQAAFGTGFMAASAEQRLELLQRLDREQLDYMNSRGEDSPSHYFRMIKELTLTGYFTSEIGMTQAQRYRETPARWDPCVPYEDGETTWAVG